MKKILILSLLFVSLNQVQANEIESDSPTNTVTDGVVLERVFNVNKLIDFSKIVDERIPSVRVKGVRMYTDCNGPRTEVSGLATKNVERSRNLPYYELSVHYAATRMGCSVDYSDSNLETFMFTEPVVLSVKDGGYYIMLYTRNSMIKSLILDINY